MDPAPQDPPPAPAVPISSPDAPPAPPELPPPGVPPDTPAAVSPEPSEVTPPPPPVPEIHPVRFHGQAAEYFRIWIVNTLLTLLSAGIFFAWAKVRKRRYLRGCTELLGHRFDYRADPRRLLIGNIIVVIFFLAYSLFGVVYPSIRYGVLAAGLILLPWIVVRSITFNAHNSAYRGMRFRFNPSLSASAAVYLFEPLALLLTLGLYYPAWVRSKRRYLVSNHRLGDAYFRFEAPTGGYYSAYLVGGALVFAAAMLAGGVVAGLATVSDGGEPGMAVIIPVLIVYGLGLFISQQFIHARLFNHVWNHTFLDDHRFVASMKTGRWLGLQFTNLGAIIVSCGLLYPWAVVRNQRYTASCLAFLPAGPVESIRHLGSGSGSATGDMAAEFIGLDFGL